MTNWFITGISRGLGRSLASAALAHGDTVVGTVRSPSFSMEHEPGRLHVIEADLAKAGSAEASVARAFELAGRIDVIVNNAGFGLLGAVENASDLEIDQLFAVDFFAPLRIIKAALPHLRDSVPGTSSISPRSPAVMEETVADPMNIDELVVASGVSRRHLERLFQLHLGMPPQRFYRQLRIERAHSLLETSLMPLIDVAVASGFVSQSHFAKVYKAFMGCTPQETRTGRKRDGGSVDKFRERALAMSAAA